MQPIIPKIHTLLRKRKETIAVAESCTCGILSAMLTALPGSSEYFLLGISAYSNRAKETLLGIPHRLIAQRGAVSAEIASRMADSVRRRARADFGVGITGIAGPGGGSKEKPVGTVFVAVSSKKKTLCTHFRFKGNRTSIRRQSALSALSLIMRILK